jgi:hypothetical protein
MGASSKISTAQLTCLMTLSSVTLMFTCNSSLLGSDHLIDNLLSCALAFLCNFLLALPLLWMVRKQPGTNVLLRSEQSGRWLLYGTAVFYILYFFLIDLQYLSTFQFFLGNVFHPDIPTWILSLLLLIAAVYSAFKGLEAMGRTSVLLLLMVLLGLLVIGVLLFSDFRSQHFTPLLLDGSRQTLLGTAFYGSGSSSIVLFALLYSYTDGKKQLGFFAWNTITYATAAFLLVLIIGTLGDYANLQLFPLYSAATMANLGTFQRMDSLFISIWMVGLFLKLAIDFYGMMLCLQSITHKRLDIIALPSVGLLLCIATILVTGSRFWLNLVLDPLLIAPLTVFAVAILPLTAGILSTIRQKRRALHG